MALNQQLAALNRQHETHTQFAGWPSQLVSSSGQ
jgi:hypothetical protein